MVDMDKQYLLDTKACISLIKNVGDVRQRIINVGIANCFVSSITIPELYYGAAKSNRPEHYQDVVLVKDHFGVISIDDSLNEYGLVKTKLERKGTPIDDFDLLIGCTALHAGMTIVTHNAKHISRIPNIRIEDWE